ncbi:hypothetical protein E2C01_020857 [Portunus trituberculatus]|uniref:Uncharacterized protein n=1 Tax=Portunus trituberculatus TaxID=210409 RepID=A0A5B7E1P5_PORTR|nr:hypothetical protein [Portunus trituberculatus]
MLLIETWITIGGHQVVVARNFLAGRGTQTATGMTGMASSITGTVTTGKRASQGQKKKDKKKGPT